MAAQAYNSFLAVGGGARDDQAIHESHPSRVAGIVASRAKTLNDSVNNWSGRLTAPKNEDRHDYRTLRTFHISASNPKAARYLEAARKNGSDAMPVKSHLFFQASTGAVYAIAITPEKWGFVRFFRGNAMAVLSVVSGTPEMPSLDWRNPPVGWIFTSFAPKGDTTEAVRLGILPFADEDSEWAPPCFVPPDPIDNCYKIHEKSTIRRATEKEVQGMRLCRRVTPAQLAEFLREKLNNGELRSV